MEVTKARHNAESMFFNDQSEEDFFFSLLDKDAVVCEYGSGYSTIAIAQRVKEIHSIEHNDKWFKEMRNQMPSNAHLYHVRPNEEEGPGEDGTYEQYKRYVDFPKRLGKPFTHCLVDGRARVACFREAMEFVQPGGIIFLHDHHNPNSEFDRLEYHIVDDWLEEIGHVYALYAYRVK